MPVLASSLAHRCDRADTTEEVSQLTSTELARGLDESGRATRFEPAALRREGSSGPPD
jgi:hypothetical protein